MKNFRVYNEDYIEPAKKSYLAEIGTALKFITNNGRISSVRSIPVLML